MSRYIESAFLLLLRQSVYFVDLGTGDIYGPSGSSIGSVNSRGYVIVALRINRETCFAQAHRLVCIAAGNSLIPENLVVNHKDGDKTNNSVFNLEIVTPAENSSHAVSMGLMSRFIGETNPAAKLSDDTVYRARTAVALGYSVYSQAKKYGVALTTMQSAVFGETWRHVPFP